MEFVLAVLSHKIRTRGTILIFQGDTELLELETCPEMLRQAELKALFLPKRGAERSTDPAKTWDLDVI